VEKEQLVAAALEPGASVSAIAPGLGGAVRSGDGDRGPPRSWPMDGGATVRTAQNCGYPYP
jgi:hypothetical protein